ncbi:MAG: hypothetical protein V7K32_27195 [Nostoc sp.]
MPIKALLFNPVLEKRSLLTSMMNVVMSLPFNDNKFDLGKDSFGSVKVESNYSSR